MLILHQPGRFGYLNLNDCAKEFRTKHGLNKPNPLNDPQTCASMLDEFHQRLGLRWSYGGWLEDRRDLWAGSYLEKEQNFVHLGIDFNVPAGSLVEVDHLVKVIRIDTERPPQIGGWGTRVTVELVEQRGIYLIYAHLEARPLCTHGEILKPGTRFGAVGHAPENGNWYPHLHFQVIDKNCPQAFQFDWSTYDGYGHASEIKNLAKVHPDPLQFWKFQ